MLSSGAGPTRPRALYVANTALPAAEPFAQLDILFDPRRDGLVWPVR